jgi:hypothetical protein
MTSKIKLLTILFLIITKSSFAQNYLKEKLNASLQITFEGQSYLERSFHDSRYYDIEKSAGIATTYNLTFNKVLLISNRLSLNYGLGAKLNNHEYDITDIFSSDWDFLEMGSSSIKSLYLSTSARLFYKKQNTKSIYLSPYIGLGLNILASKYEKLIPLKSGYETLINPEFGFKRLVPEASIGFLCFYNPKTIKYGFAFGPSVNNNAKYYREKIGILSFPLSFSMNLSISRM